MADPISIIIGALIAGAGAAAKDVADKAVKDAYQGFRTLIVRKFGSKTDVEEALAGVEKKPESEARQSVLKEELTNAGAAQDTELIEQAQAFLALLKEDGVISAATYQATVSGSGAAAQDHSVAAGEGGVAVGGNVEGGINLGGGTDKDKKK
jgi:hypothetical protein